VNCVSPIKIRILKEYLEMVILKDVVERYNIKNTKVVRWLIKAVITSVSKEFSVHKVYLTLKSQNITLSKNTLYTYLSILEDVLFIFLVPKFSFSERKQDLSINKIYLCDCSFSKIFESSSNTGKKIENVVFLELMRRKKILTDISYWKNKEQQEVDFVVKTSQKIDQLIQVGYDIEDTETKKREITAPIKAGKELNCNDLLVITWDYEAEEVVEEKKIKFIPLWKWLLT